MANIMNMKSLRNKPSRNGFDLSFKRNFTAKVGELLPVMCKEVYPGDVFNIDLSAFSRTMPVNTAAYARIKEYYDFYFVPYELLWNKSFTLLTQMFDNSQHAISPDPTKPFNLKGEMPYVTTRQIEAYLEAFGSSGSVASDAKENMFGYNRADLSIKLLEYLGLGDYSHLATGAEVKAPNVYNLDLNIMSLLAYQKIYADHFRDSQWENISPSTFNVDYLSGTDSMNVDTTQASFRENYNFFDLRYCNWQKDMFHGLLPRAQYGDEAVVPLGGIDGLSELEVRWPTKGDRGDGTFGKRLPLVVSGNGSLGSSPYIEGGDSVVSVMDGTDSSYILSPVSLMSSSSSASLSILALRQAEMLQKWREITQSANKDFKSQLEKHWNVSVGDGYSEMSEYLGGMSSNLGINEVVNTNLTGDNPQADIAGKGVGTGQGHVRFDSKGRYGVLMCIYHAVPMLDYTTGAVDRMHMKVNAADFAIPEFDRIGMESVPIVALSNNYNLGRPTPEIPTDMVYLGYAPRYIDLKTSVDSSVGAFKTTLKHWVVNFNNAAMMMAHGVGGSPVEELPSVVTPNFVNYVFNKVNPSSVDPIFVGQADSTVDSDQFLCSTFFDIKAVRNFDTDGLPY